MGITITTLDEKLRKHLEPKASSVKRRLAALKTLNEIGIKTYAFIGPIFPYLVDVEEIFKAVRVMCKTEGLIPALETAHAVAYMLNHNEEFCKDDVVVLNYSGRGDKDLETILRYFEIET